MTRMEQIEAAIRKPYSKTVRFPVGDHFLGALVVDDLRVVSRTAGDRRQKLAHANDRRAALANGDARSHVAQLRRSSDVSVLHLDPLLAGGVVFD